MPSIEGMAVSESPLQPPPTGELGEPPVDHASRSVAQGNCAVNKGRASIPAISSGTRRGTRSTSAIIRRHANRTEKRRRRRVLVRVIKSGAGSGAATEPGRVAVSAQRDTTANRIKHRSPRAGCPINMIFNCDLGSPCATGAIVKNPQVISLRASGCDPRNHVNISKKGFGKSAPVLTCWSWNVEYLGVGDIPALIARARAATVDVIFLQEVRWTVSTDFWFEGARIITVGVDSHNTVSGVGVILLKRGARALLSYRPLDYRALEVTFRTGAGPWHFLVCHFPNESLPRSMKKGGT